MLSCFLSSYSVKNRQKSNQDSSTLNKIIKKNKQKNAIFKKKMYLCIVFTYSKEPTEVSGAEPVNQRLFYFPLLLFSIQDRS